MTLLTFARQSKAGTRQRGYSGERLVNYFLRAEDGISGGVLIGRSGVVRSAFVQASVRAMVACDGAIYAVGDGLLWKVVGSAATIIGALPNKRDTYMATSGTEVAIVVDGRYFLTDGASLTEHTTGAVEVPKAVAYSDGYFIVIGEGQGRKDTITVSALDDGSTFDALEFAHAESAPDQLVGIVADHGQIWLLGTETVEVWYNAGSLDFPFAPNRGALMEKGCIDGKTVAKADNAVFWVGSDNIVYRASGGAPVVVSSRAVEENLKGKTILGGFTFTDRGHKFYAVTVEGAPSWVFDITMSVWHERSTGIGEKAWTCQCRATLDGVEYLGCDTGVIATLDDDTFTDDGKVMEGVAVSVPVQSGGDPFAIARVHLEMDVGFGTIGRTPQIMMQTTKDGRNWSVEKWRSVGDTGDYGKIVRWHGLGSFRRFQARLRVTDPVRRDLYGVAVV
jgi:hypothetical protein